MVAKMHVCRISKIRGQRPFPVLYCSVFYVHTGIQSEIGSAQIGMVCERGIRARSKKNHTGIKNRQVKIERVINIAWIGFRMHEHIGRYKSGLRASGAMYCQSRTFTLYLNECKNMR